MNVKVFHRFAHDRRGNVAMIFGIMAIPLVFAIGMGIDYGNNSRKWSQMNAAADAAALAAVTPSMMSASDATAQTAATDMFSAQTNTISNLVAGSLNPTITITDSGLTRTATVSYTAQLNNVFGGVLGQPTMTVSGSSKANGATPPNVNFYLLLDTSPSMAIPASAAGISLLVSKTSAQGGCAFACHESNPTSGDVAGNPGGEDNYALAKSLTDPDTGAIGLTLRIDELGAAATAMVSSAIDTMSQNQSNYGWTPTYQIAVNTFDTGLHSLYSLTSNLTTLQSNLQANPSPIQLFEVYSNNNICTGWTTTTTKNKKTGVSTTTTSCTSYTGNNDADTDIDDTLTGMNTLMPTPGDGAKGDNPAEVLMIVTDGVEDQIVSSITSGYAPGGNTRQEAPMAAGPNTNPGTNTPNLVPSATLCTTIKNRGIKIAVLYTTYYPLDDGSEGSWYDKSIYPFQPNGVDQIGPALMTNCASPGLFYQVNVGENISAALVTLFQMALQSSHLTQ